MASHSVNSTVSCRSFLHSNMLARILAIFSVSFVITRVTDGAPVVATGRQFLPALPGYIPVYIRSGDTPLEEINPDLAEAFNSYSLKHARRAFSRSNNAITNKSDAVGHSAGAEESKGSINDVTSSEYLNDSDNDEVTQSVEIVYESQHIQKIPKA